MADPTYPLLEHIGGMIAAVAALGTAASGLVDATKLLPGRWLNISRRGQGVLFKALDPFKAALTKAIGAAWLDAVIGHWINGDPKDDQKKQTKSLIRLGLTADNAAAIAVPGHVDPDALKTAVEKLETGADLQTVDTNVLGRLDASVDAILDAAYDRADQLYRNTAKFVAGVFAVGLSVWGNAIYNATVSAGLLAARDDAHQAALKLAKTLAGAANQAPLVAARAAEAAANAAAAPPPHWNANVWVAILVGIVAVPLAPVAKDLTSALQNGVKAIASTMDKKS